MNIRHALGAGAAAFALSGMAMGAHATALTAAQQGLADLSEFNVIVLGNMTASSDVEGNAFVGGNLSGSAANFGTGSTTGQGYTTSSNPTLTVVGNVTLGGLQINGGYSPAGVSVGGSVSNLDLNASNATVLVAGKLTNFNGSSGSTVKYGSKSGNFNTNGASATKYSSSAATALTNNLKAEGSDMTSDLEALSSKLAGLTPTKGDSVTVSNGNLVVTANANTSAGYVVIDTTTAVINSASNVLEETLKAVSGGGDIPVIINVTGSTADLSFNQGSTQQYDPYVLWNFENATSIDAPRGFNGAILGAYASLSNSSAIQGSVAVAGFNQGGEDHLGTFESGMPLMMELGGVPEPADWVLMIVGVGFTGAALRRRRTGQMA